MPDLKGYVWRRFRHVLIGAHTAVLILCAGSLLLLHEAPKRGSTSGWP